MATVVSRVCEIDGCEQAHVARGWCSSHYRKWKRSGDPLGVDQSFCRNRVHEMTPENTYTYPSGRRKCRACMREADADRHRRNRDRRNAAKAEHRQLHGDRYRRGRLARFGLTEADYQSMLAAQGGCCAICRTDMPGGRWDTHFHVDHDHVTGRVRGLLCSHCNLMLGNAKDDPERLRAAADYLDVRTA